MISTRLIGWAALITILVAAIFSGFAYEVSPSVFWNWLGTLLATFISVLSAVGVGLVLFNYQTAATDERKRRDLARLAATEMRGIIETLQKGAGTGGYRATYLHSPMAEQAARSGLLDPQTTADMMQFAWNVQLHNQFVAQFNAIQNSLGVNPNASTILQIYVDMGRNHRDTMIEAARFILNEVLQKYPQAFAKD